MSDGFNSIMNAPFPKKEDFKVDLDAEAQMTVIQDTITAIRKIRGENGVSDNKKIHAMIHLDNPESFAVVLERKNWIMQMAGCKSLEIVLIDEESGQKIVAKVDNNK